jgi:hypothetical protein
MKTIVLFKTNSVWEKFSLPGFHNIAKALSRQRVVPARVVVNSLYSKR